MSLHLRLSDVPACWVFVEFLRVNQSTGNLVLKLKLKYCQFLNQYISSGVGYVRSIFSKSPRPEKNTNRLWI